jgi:Xaa-Pro aminopeptidase
MTIALELHLMESDGYTLKLEDTLHITETGAEILTLSPRLLIEVQAYLQHR